MDVRERVERFDLARDRDERVDAHVLIGRRRGERHPCGATQWREASCSCLSWLWLRQVVADGERVSKVNGTSGLSLDVKWTLDLRFERNQHPRCTPLNALSAASRHLCARSSFVHANCDVTAMKFRRAAK